MIDSIGQEFTVGDIVKEIGRLTRFKVISSADDILYVEEIGTDVKYYLYASSVIKIEVNNMKDSNGIELKIGDIVISSDYPDTGMTFKVESLRPTHSYVGLLEVSRDECKTYKNSYGNSFSFPFKPTRSPNQLTIIPVKNKRTVRLSKERDEKLTARTIKIIERGGHIVLKRDDGFYLHCYTNIASGIDGARWGRRNVAIEIFNLKWAFAISKLYDCKVFSVYL